ncbi:MAG TPA: c-type cytochrome biogenesis protein CcmI [Casimicrobiaceae bacterium]|nr:c-type cytochrome biogenesis protein CcmI [Casimicrobiaceae bacterium]
MSSAVVFWLVAALIVLVTLGVLLRALLARRAVDAAPAPDSASIAIFRDQKRQLDEDLANGVLDATEHARLVDELARRLGHEVEAVPAEPTAAPAGSPLASIVTAIALAVVLPAAAAGIYLALGQPASFVAAPRAGERPETQAQVVAMIDTLARRMRENPADPRGWALLGHSYAALGRYDDAVRAYSEAATRAPDDASILADYADVLSMAQGTLQGKPSELIERALAIDAHNRKALALGAAAASERRDFDTALTRWRALAAALPADSDTAREVAQVIADVEKQRAAASASAANAPSANAPAASALAANSSGASAADAAAPVANARAASAAGTAPPANGPVASPAAPVARIAGDVSLAPELAARAAPGDTVFIFARAVNGPRMPLAVLRTTVHDLPRDFVLDDTMAMAPGATLSSAKQVVVEARVSKGGSATPASGDLVGKSAPVAPGTTNIHVRIDAVNP